MNQTERSPILLPLAVIAVTVLVILAGMNVVKLDKVRRDGAQTALWQRIQKELKSYEATGQFPTSLSELHLQGSDDWDDDMLQLFEFRSEGTTCEVSTTHRGVRKTASFGKPAP